MEKMRLFTNAEFWIAKLKLMPHPEGGYYQESYRSAETIDQKCLPSRFSGTRHFSTAIYFLLKDKQFSAFHRIRSDETWHFYYGNPLEIFVINSDKSLDRLLLGHNPDANEQLQLTIPANHWFAARVIGQEGFSLVGCTVSPGFHFQDFELASKSGLLQQYPEHSSLIRELCLDI